MASGMKLALCPLSRNVVRANPARPSGAGSAAGTLSISVTGRSETKVAIAFLLPAPIVPPPGGRSDAEVTGRKFFHTRCSVRSARHTRRTLRLEVVGVARHDVDAVVGD